MSAAVILVRRPKSGRRAAIEIPVTVVGRTPAGAFIVQRYRGYRLIQQTVAAKNIGPLVEFKAAHA